MNSLCWRAVLPWLAVTLSLQAQTPTTIDIDLPTNNDALFRGGGQDFYQYIERDFEGLKTTPWEGGRYGFVRNPVQTVEGIVYTRFHEGIDIRPLQRDARGEPLDEVKAIADGKVVHTNPTAGDSNYGRYVVVEHTWGGSPYYSLYGHLSTIAVSIGETMHRGQVLGRMGYTGKGLNQARAHVHLELNLMLNREFDGWHKRYFPNEVNHNGIYNGINLAGIDIARFYLEHEKNAKLTVPQFLAEEDTFYKVTLPASSHFDLPRLYPWMIKNVAANARSWEVSFNRAGVPLRLEARSEVVAGPALSYVRKSEVDYSYLTRGQIAGRGQNAHLSESGLALMHLVMFPD